jgi:MoaA/NifB/PqqE/SkfB family radical SAM enzyme
MPKPLLTRVREVVHSLRQRARGLPSAPDWVQVEINNTCNLRCVMCPRDAMSRPPHHMTLDQFRDIADKCRAAGVPRLRLFFMGEPLLHPDLIEMIRYAKAIGTPSVEFNTNAALLDEAKADALLDSGLDEIVFSLDGTDAPTYEAIRVGGHFDEVMARVESFCRLRNERGLTRPRTTVQTIVMDGTRDQITDFRARWEPVADAVEVTCVREYHTVSGVRTTDLQPGDELRPCPALWEQLVILADLRVIPCCVDINGDMSLGSIADTDIETLWRTNQRLKDLRARHLRYDYRGYPLCKGCEFTNASVVRRKIAEARDSQQT